MAAVASVNSIGLLPIEQASPFVNPAQDERARAHRRAAKAGNGEAEQSAGVDVRATAAQSKLAEELFEMSAPSISQMKLELFTRAGKAVGIEQAGFATPAEFAAAIAQAVDKLRREPDGERNVQGLEHELGLDKLGIGLSVLVGAIAGGGDANARLDQALREATRQSLPDRTAVVVQRDDIGAYSPVDA